MNTQDTIVAMATPPGFGGIGIVRLSGTQAYTIATQLVHDMLQIQVAKVKKIYASTGEILDQGIVLYFQSPHSFTGEDIIEFQCHGSPVVLQCIVKTCIEKGARLATPGEFSLRAFLNGKIDLIQAEAIADLIHASSEKAAKMALSSLEGVFSKHIMQLHDQLVQWRVFIEAMIDFSEEEIDALSIDDIQTQITVFLHDIATLILQAQQGVFMTEGIKIVITGVSNVGKSTLMNALAQRDIAIVTDVEGTTRDVIKENLLLNDLPVILVDTAGLRDTDCIVEQAGIDRAIKVIKEADLVLQVLDMTQPIQHQQLIPLPAQIPVIQVFNKMDLCQTTHASTDTTVYLSAKHHIGIERLKQAIFNTVGFHGDEGYFIARLRHKQALDVAQEHLKSAYHDLTTHAGLELVAESLRLAQGALAEMTGRITPDDLLGKIFSTFCIGK